MQRSAKYALIAVVAVIVLGGAGFYWFFLRDDAPSRASLQTTNQTAAPGVTEPASVDGTWTVQQADGVFVGYRVQELFGGQTLKVTAVGRTPAVTGTLVVSGSQITSADITADVTKLTSDKSQRDQQVKVQGLQTNQFPTATFKLTEPIALPSAPEKGKQIEVTATGDLTLHGQTKSVQIPLQAQWNGTTITVAGTAKVAFSDYGMTAPTSPIVSVDDNGELELQLTFVPATGGTAPS